jgi:hypothetical protein
MIFKFTKLLVIIVFSVYLAACSSSSTTSSVGTDVTIYTAPSPAIAAAMDAGVKTFTNDSDVSITLTKAYLVISSATIETSCTAFSAAADGLLNILMPQANAHTTATPTSTGEPYVVNLLTVDGDLSSIGSLSPPVGDYCGVDIDMLAADADATNLPAGTGEPDMIGKTLFIEGTYTSDGGITTGNIAVSTGEPLQNRELLLNALMMISAGSLNGTINIGINYDRWFDAVDLSLLESESAAKAGDNYNQLLLNITNSIHQI